MMERDTFMEYFSLFNARKYDEFPKFYSSDVEYIMDADKGKIFNGPQAIVDLYLDLHQYFDERVDVENYASSDTLVAVEVPTVLKAKRKFDKDGFIPIPEGQACKLMCFNHYDLDADGKFKRIRVAFHSIEYVPLSEVE